MRNEKNACLYKNEKKMVCEIAEQQKMKTKSRKGENDGAEKATHVWSTAHGTSREMCFYL